MEHESNTGVLESKIDQILSIMNEIKTKVESHSTEITNIQIKLALQEQTDKNLKDSIEKIEKKNDDNKKWILGLLGTMITGVAMLIVRYFVGM